MNAPFRIKFRGSMSTEFDVWTEITFDSDNGGTSSFLNQEAMASEVYDGSFRRVYGYRYNEILSPQFTFVKQDYTDFSEDENRKMLAWLTSSKTATFLDVYLDKSEVVAYSLLGNFVAVEQYKLSNERVVGYVCTFECVSPYAFSLPITKSITTTNGTGTLVIDCRSDELDKPIYPKLTITQIPNGNQVMITNNSITTIIQNNIGTEQIIVDGANKLIYSLTRDNRIFGNDFNWNWLPFTTGKNNITIEGNCIIDFEWREPRKVGSL